MGVLDGLKGAAQNVADFFGFGKPSEQRRNAAASAPDESSSSQREGMRCKMQFVDP